MQKWPSHQYLTEIPVGSQDSFTIYKLYLRIKMRNILVEEQIQWVLLYIYGGSADIQKENVIENLENKGLEFLRISY